MNEIENMNNDDGMENEIDVNEEPVYTGRRRGDRSGGPLPTVNTEQ